MPTDELGGEIPDERPQRHREWSGALRSVGLPLIAVALIVGAVWYLQRGRSSASQSTPGTGVIALDAARNHTGQPASAAKGRAAPDFRVNTLDGKTVRLSDLQGKTVLVNFWATWCAPCRAEMPEIVRAYQQYHDKGFEVVAVDEQEGADTVRKWVDLYGMQFPVGFDPNGDVGQTFHAQGEFPTSVFIDPQGRITDIHPGQMSREFIDQHLAALQ